MTDLVVGFDLDMTLVDSKPGISDTLVALAQETGLELFATPELLDALIYHNVDAEFALRFPADEATVHADRFRELYVTHGVPGTSCLPGAQEAVAAVRALAGESVVITAKHEPNARRCLAHVDLEIEHVVGRHWGDEKSAALVRHGVAVYVGDTVTDVKAARRVGVTAVAVTTGPHDADQLHEAGADVVLGSLEEFPAWLAAFADGREPRPD